MVATRRCVTSEPAFIFSLLIYHELTLGKAQLEVKSERRGWDEDPVLPLDTARFFSL